ncbi:MAG TPA: hypothetical protein VKT78_04855 [Fimbriimonadaceae bacterium]|nr:hypothetical protein [Fimbriimonadaceae bacterium]
MHSGREFVLQAVAILASADETAKQVLHSEQEGDEADGTVPFWWACRYGEISAHRHRLERLCDKRHWTTKRLGVDVVREIVVVRRALARALTNEPRHLEDVDRAIRSGIHELDLALGAWGLCAISLREAAYLQTLTEFGIAA